MIDEKKLIERLEEKAIKTLGINRSQFAMDKGEYSSYCSLSLDEVKEIVKDLASEHNNGWIRVEDALPEDGTEVLVYMTDYNEMSVALYNGVQKLFYSNDFTVDMSKYIIAWQPLPPAPYKKGE